MTCTENPEAKTTATKGLPRKTPDQVDTEIEENASEPEVFSESDIGEENFYH